MRAQIARAMGAEEVSFALDDGAGSTRSDRTAIRIHLVRACVLLAIAMGTGMAVSGWDRSSLFRTVDGSVSAQDAEIPVSQVEAAPAAIPAAERTPIDLFPPRIMGIVLFLIGCSAFFSGSEAAFFSIHKIRLKAMGSSSRAIERAISALMDHPGRLLTTILMGNMIVNVLIGVFLGTRVEAVFGYFGLSVSASFVSAVIVTSIVLVLFGEILPKVLAVRTNIFIASIGVFPLTLVDWILAPARDSMIWVTNKLLHATGVTSGTVTPFITDHEFKAVLEDGETHGVIEEDERQMIEGILESSDAMLKEIYIPRTGIIAIQEDATIDDALSEMRKHQFSRMPVFRDDIDQITGLLVLKDLLPAFAQGNTDARIKQFARPVLFVPGTMSVQQFVREAQRKRAHLAVVVDEYGGTSGVVALEDALELIVGDIFDEDEVEEPEYVEVGPGVYRVSGQIDLETVSELVHVDLKDDEHETLAGFLMDQAEKILESGDTIESGGVRFTVEECEGRRVSQVRVEAAPMVLPDAEEVKGHAE